MTSIKYSILTVLLVMMLPGCRGGSEITQAITPVVKDGITRYSMNNLVREYNIEGNWSGPILVKKEKKFYRVVTPPGGSLGFFAPRDEPYLVQIKTRRNQEPFEFKIGSKVFRVEKEKQVFNIDKNQVQMGQNRLLFLPGQDGRIALEEIRIAPRRLAGSLKGSRPQGRIYTPARLVFYLDPASRQGIRLKFDLGQQKETEINIETRSESGQRKTARSISRKPFELLPMDKTLHEFVLSFPGKGNSYVTLEKSEYFSSIDAQTGSRNKKIGNHGRFRSKEVKNVLVIVLDAARADHFGAYGYGRQTTPNIDRLTEESILFTNCISEAAYTLASTATLLTGLPPDFHNVISTFHSRLDDKIITLPALFREKGFFTGALSSNPYVGKAYNLHKGFDHFEELFKEQKAVMADAFLEPFGRVLEKAGDKPFFIYLHLREPHIEYLMPAPFLGTFQDKYKRQSPQMQLEADRIFHRGERSEEDLGLLNDLYDENLLYGDYIVGKLLDLLKNRGLYDVTIKVILSDHGEGLGEHGQVGHNVVLYKEGLHIPLILHIPGFPLDRDRVIDGPALTSDLAVTLAEWFELDYPYKEFSQGKNLFDLPPSRIRISRTMQVKKYTGYRVESFPYELHFFPPFKPGNVKLFHLGNDPGEKNPLARAGMIERFLFYRLDHFLDNSARPHFSREAAKLDKKDLESLKSLGYLD